MNICGKWWTCWPNLLMIGLIFLLMNRFQRFSRFINYHPPSMSMTMVLMQNAFHYTRQSECKNDPE